MGKDLALLVDGDQLPPDGLPDLITRLQRQHRINERICVRNWRSTKDQKEWRAFASDHGFRLIQRDPVATGKNAADIEVTVEAMDLLHRGVEAFCLVSGDMDFTPLVERIKRAGASIEWVRPSELGTKRTNTSRRGGSAPTAPKAKPAPRTPKPRSAPAPAAPAALTGQQKRLARPVRQAIDRMKKAGQHEKGWVSVNRLGSLLAADGHRREDHGFAKSRPLRDVLEDLGFKVMQIETGAYRVAIA